MKNLRIARRMGWTYADVLDLPVDVYLVLVEELIAEQDTEGD